MFTGIVEGTGEVLSTAVTDDGRRIRLAAPFADELAHGQSVSVSGACLTVEAADGTGFEVFCATETLERTYLGELAAGDQVNLERAMAADGRFDGHVVQGHVDGVGEVTGIEQVDEDRVFSFSLPANLGRYVVEKGSIAVDGVSLTVAALHEDGVDVAVVPATLDQTTLSAASVGDPVHLEVDVLAKYVESLLDRQG